MFSQRYLSQLNYSTRIQVSNLDQHYDLHVPYCHWTFPDDKFENNEPSYMMARKLNRLPRQASKVKPVEESLAVQITQYKPPSVALSTLILSSTKRKDDKSPSRTPTKSSKKRKLHPDEPIRPKRPKTGYFFFLDAERQKMKSSDQKLKTTEFMKLSSIKWNELSEKDKSIYEMKREDALVEYEKKMKNYDLKMEKFKAEHPDWHKSMIQDIPQKVKNAKNLFNKVVRLTDEGRREAGTEFEYYYVLTYIPDLFWCHLAPMKTKGTFGTKWPAVKGRPRWVLVGEEEGKELDISAAVCEIVKSRCLKKCIDADKEEWDICDTMERSTSATAATCNASIVSNCTSSVKESATTISSEESDEDTDSVQKGIIKTDTMYSRLLRKRNSDLRYF